MCTTFGLTNGAKGTTNDWSTTTYKSLQGPHTANILGLPTCEWHITSIHSRYLFVCIPYIFSLKFLTLLSEMKYKWGEDLAADFNGLSPLPFTKGNNFFLNAISLYTNCAKELKIACPQHYLSSASTVKCGLHLVWNWKKYCPVHRSTNLQAQM